MYRIYKKILGSFWGDSEIFLNKFLSPIDIKIALAQ